MSVWKEIVAIANIPEEELIIINSLGCSLENVEELKMRCQAEEKIIDKYIENIVKKIGYIPKDCSDKNIVYEACLGCGLCNKTNPIYNLFK